MLKFLLKTLKQVIRPLISEYRNKIFWPYVIHRKRLALTPSVGEFDFSLFAINISRFIDSMVVDRGSPFYHFSSVSSTHTLYSSAYACMTYSLLGRISSFDSGRLISWSQYFDSFQCQDDGLFYDPAVENPSYHDSDWWGARHLALHMVPAYRALGSRPKYPFKFLQEYYNNDRLYQLINEYDWSTSDIGNTDIDNKIMNIGCLLQFQRDFWMDKQAASALNSLKYLLRRKINPETGMWGGFDVQCPSDLSRMVQFAYHLLPIFFYDRDFDFSVDNIIFYALKTQNRFGGFGVLPNSSACEDIDTIDILIRLYSRTTPAYQNQIKESIHSALSWVLLNQVNDGGFVFRLNQSFHYGSDNMFASSNHGNMMSTWFRTLSVAYMTKFLEVDNNFSIARSPGYEF